MGATTTVTSVLWRASVLLMDAAPQWTRYSEQQLCAWLDDAYMVLAKFLPSSCARIDAVKLQTGTRQTIASVAGADLLPGDGSSAPTFTYGLELLGVVRDMGANGTTVGNVIRRTEREGQDAAAPDWHTRLGTVPTVYMYDPRTPKHFYVSPSLSARRWVELAWAVQPVKTVGGAPGAEVFTFPSGSAAADKTQVGDEHSDDLVNYIVARANMAPVEWADANKAAAFASAFLQSLNARVAALTGFNPNLKALPMSTEIGRAAQ